MLRSFAALALALPVPAQAVTLHVTVKAGEVARVGSPAAATFPWPDALRDALAALDTDRPVSWTASLVEVEREAAVPCEVLAMPAVGDAAATGALRFVLASLAAGAEMRCRLVLGDGKAAAASKFTTASRDDARELLHGDAVVLRHEHAFDRADFERTSRPIWHLLLPGTDVQLTKGAGGEFPHHRGLFLGWNRTRVGDATFDFWHCRDAGQRHAGFELPREVQSAVRGEVTSGTHWLSPLDESVVRDRRTLTVWERAGEGRESAPTMVDVAIELSADRAIELRGDPQHAGVQLRVADEVAQRKDARYVRPASAQGGKDDVWTDCPWVAGLFTIGGREVAIAHMSHPSNPQPVAYSTRDYGRFGAFFTADIAPDRPLHLRYRLLIVPIDKDTDTSAERFARDYADFATPVVVEVR